MRDILLIRKKRLTTLKEIEKELKVNPLINFHDAMGSEAINRIELFFQNMNKFTYTYSESSHKDSLLVELLFIFLKVNYGSYIKGAQSYFSHVQGFFTFFKEKKKIEALFEDVFESSTNMLEEVFDKLEESSFNFEISNFIITHEEKIKEDILSKNINFTNHKISDNLLKNSEFHQRIYNDVFFSEALNSIDFQVRRFFTICFYEYLFLGLEIDYQKRCLLSYMVYRFIEEKYEVDYLNGV